MLLKEVIVAKIHIDQPAQSHVYFQYGLDLDDDHQGVILTRKTWDELGQPDVITVAIEAGHNLDVDEHKRTLLDKIPSRVPNVQLTIPGQA